jgi:hypothetical protein
MNKTVRFFFALIFAFLACLSTAQALTLSGTVYGGSTPMAGASVTLTDITTATQVGQVVSNANGTYTFPGHTRWHALTQYRVLGQPAVS